MRLFRAEPNGYSDNDLILPGADEAALGCCYLPESLLGYLGLDGEIVLGMRKGNRSAIIPSVPLKLAPSDIGLQSFSAYFRANSLQEGYLRVKGCGVRYLTGAEARANNRFLGLPRDARTSSYSARRIIKREVGGQNAGIACGSVDKFGYDLNYAEVLAGRGLPGVKKAPVIAAVGLPDEVVDLVFRVARSARSYPRERIKDTLADGIY